VSGLESPSAEGDFVMEDSDFQRLLHEVLDLDGSKSVDALLEHPVFKRRGKIICQTLTRNQADAEDLFEEVCIRVWQNMLDKFTLHETYEYGGFFAWVRTIAQHKFLDDLDKVKAQFDDKRAEDLSIKDSRVDIEGELLRREREEEVKRTIESLPREQRLAAKLYILKGRSSRRTAQVLNRLGIECSHVTIITWVRDGLKPLFPERESSVVKTVRKVRARRRVRPGSKATPVKKKAGR
jgi:RNA polymerase sigma factor (sigma-70 family)